MTRREEGAEGAPRGIYQKPRIKIYTKKQNCSQFANIVF